jgi:endonuclease/exonuclease/phosphatase family metal-dependent hydrolase
VQDPEYALITGDGDGQAARLVDCWSLFHGERPHDPTCGIFDRKQWPEGPHCRDFFFVSEELSSRINNVRVDCETAASDHQPVSLSIDA